MRKELIALIMIAAIFFADRAFAQKVQIGVKAGFNSSNWHGDTKAYAASLVKDSRRFSISDKQGFHAGVFLNIPVTAGLSFQPGINYSQKGLKVSYRQPVYDFVSVNAVLTNQAHYIDMPVQLKYNFGNNLDKASFFITGGGQVSYLVSNQLRGELQALGLEVGHTINFNSPFRKWDAAIQAGAGVDIGKFSIGAGYEYGLVSLDKTFNTGFNNRVIKLGLGYRF